MVTTTTIGDIEVTALIDHIPPPIDVRKIYPNVPTEAWDPYRNFALNHTGQWQTQYCAFLIRPTSGAGTTILVDSGIGAGPNPPGNTSGKLIGELDKLGVPTNCIDAVVITHPHGDHIGWNVTYNASEKPLPTFSNAQYFIAQADWDYWTEPKIADLTPAIGRSLTPLNSFGLLRLVKGKEQIAPGVSTLPTNGHTPGHQCVLIESRGHTGVIVGDLIHNVAQVTKQDWCPTFDWNQDMARSSRKSLLRQAAIDGWIVMAGHLEFGTNIGNIVELNGVFTWSHLQ